MPAKKLSISLSLALLTILPAAAQQPAGDSKPLPAAQEPMPDLKLPPLERGPAPPELGPRPAGALQSAPVSPKLPGAYGERGKPLGRTPAQLHFDEDSDGRVWVNAAAYKASFGPEGCTYVPFFGSEAPRNWPLRFQVEGASVDGEALPLAAPIITQEATFVDLARGALVERYLLDPETLEQTFVFDALPRRGTLRIEMSLDTDLEARRVADGIELSCGSGTVHMGDVSIVDARGRRTAAETRLEGTRVVLEVPGDFVRAAQLPLVVDPVVANFNVDRVRYLRWPDSAFDDTNSVWMLVMEEVFSATDTDVWTQHLDASANPVAGTDAYVDFTTSSWERPKVAGNNLSNQFLAVAQRINSSSGSTIWGRTREAGTGAMGTQFEISGTLSGAKLAPDVGGDPLLVGPTYYCVTWVRAFASNDLDIHYRMVSPSGVLQGSGTQYVDNSGGTSDVWVAISDSNGAGQVSGQRWNLAWIRQASSVTAPSDVLGAQIGWSGTLLAPTFTIASGPEINSAPSVSSSLLGGNGDRQWVCAFQRLFGSGDHDIVVRAMLGDTPQNIYNLGVRESSAIGQSILLRDQIEPHAVAIQSEFRVSYSESYNGSSSDYDIYSTTLAHITGALAIIEPRELLAVSTTLEGQINGGSVHAAGGASDAQLAVWSDLDLTSGEGDIEGALLVPTTDHQLLSTPICSAANNSTGGGSYLRVLGSPSLAENRLRLDVHNLPAGQFGFFLTGRAAGMVPVGQGTLCIDPVVRLNSFLQNSGSSRAVYRELNLNGMIASGAISPGTQYFQFWHRDTVGGASTSNLSNAVRVFLTN